MRTLLLACAALLGGCPSPPSDPCDIDPAGCSLDTSGFERDPTCVLSGAEHAPLAVTLGQGDNGFVPLVNTAPLVLHYGPQGGVHTWLAVRIANPLVDDKGALRYRQFKTHLEVAGTPSSYDAPQVHRDLILGKKTAVSVTDAGAVQASGIVVFLWNSGSAPRTVSATIEDPCGRTGTTTVVLPPPSQ